MTILKKMTKAAVTVASAAVLTVGIAAAPAATAAEPDTQLAGAEVITIEPGERYDFGGNVAGDSDVIGPLYHNCSTGWICFYTQTGGYGSKCQYSTSNTNAAAICSWGLYHPRSVWNRTNYRVHYYSRTSYYGRIGSTLSGVRGNLAGTYTIRSLCFGSSCPYR